MTWATSKQNSPTKYSFLRESAKKLAEDSNLKVESHPLQGLGEGVLAGKWEEVK